MFRDDPIISLNDSTPVLNMKWAIVDEIVFEKNIMGVPFDPKVSALFADHDPLWNIEYDQVYIDFPFSVYAVGEVDGKLANVSSEVRKTDLYSKSEDYGDRYCFSYLKIGDAHDVIRYATYTYHTKYLVEQSGGNGPEDKKVDKSQDSIDELPEREIPTQDLGVEPSPLEMSVDKRKDESSGENTTPYSTVGEKSPEESNNTQEMSVDKRKDESSGENTTPYSMVGDKSLEDSSIDKSLEDSSVDKSPEESSVDKSPEDSSVDKSLEDSSVDKSPEDSSVDKSPEDSSVYKSLEDSSVDKSKQDLSVDESPVDKSQEELKTPESNGEIQPEKSPVEETPELGVVPFVVPTPDANECAMQESESANSRLSVPTIYFVENINGKNVTLWGFTNRELFVRL
jgi:hypothetical protein